MEREREREWADGRGQREICTGSVERAAEDLGAVEL